MEFRSPGGILSVHIIKNVLQVPFIGKNTNSSFNYTVAVTDYRRSLFSRLKDRLASFLISNNMKKQGPQPMASLSNSSVKTVKNVQIDPKTTQLWSTYLNVTLSVNVTL